MAINAPLKLKVRKKLLKSPNVVPCGDKQVIAFCPFCKKDKTHGHFYITLDPSSDTPIIYHCFRCEMAGILNGEVMRGLGVRELSLNSELMSYNKKSLNKYGGAIDMKSNFIALGIPLGHEDTDGWKRKYINDRLGLDMSFEELQTLKCIFRLGDLLDLNNIKKLSCSKEKAKLIHTDYVGFVTAKNEFVSFRDCTGKNAKRYIKYDIFGGLFDNTRKFYTIPNQIDVLTTDTINIVLAEGYFDILGVYKHIFNGKTDNMIYAAICGCGYETVIKFFIQSGFIGSNINVHIFSDKDKSIDFYSKSIKNSNVKDWVNSVTIYYNSHEGEKDYGVPKDRIRLVKKQV